MLSYLIAQINVVREKQQPLNGRLVWVPVRTAISP
jgi:hypothetical protein